MNKVMSWLSEKFSGKKTFTTLGVMILMNVAKYFDVEIADESATTAINVLLTILAALFRAVAKPKEQTPDEA